MYCPRCGRQPIADTLRFCSYCGFKLGVVKASLADDDEGSTMMSTIQVLPKPPRQRDINIGVILMFAGAIAAAVLAGRGGAGFGREGGALLLAISFASILLLSRPILKLIYKLLSWEEPPANCFSLNQRRMVFGSMLMFASTIVLAVSSLLMFGRMETPEFFFSLMAAFVVILIISKHLIRALRYLVADDAEHAPVSMVATDSSPALTPGQDVPVSLFTSQRVTTAEILTPASVTEQTTDLLENK